MTKRPRMSAAMRNRAAGIGVTCKDLDRLQRAMSPPKPRAKPAAKKAAPPKPSRAKVDAAVQFQGGLLDIGGKR